MVDQTTRAAMPSGPARGRSLAALILLALLAGQPLLTNLGGSLLWADEADTAVFARSIVRHGLPLAWDGRTFTDSDYGDRIAPHRFGADFVMVGTPWLPFYLTAGSFALFGESALAARLPFALAAVAAVLVLFALVLRASGDRRAAWAAALLLILSTQFLLYGRECRHYALNMLLTPLLLLGFLRLREHRFDPWLAVAAVLLFHCQPLPAVAGLGACAALTLVHPAYRPLRRRFWIRLPLIGLLTLPWLPVAWSEMAANASPIESLWELPVRQAQFAIEAAEAIPYLGWAVGFWWFWRSFGARDREWLALAGAVIGVSALLTPIALDSSLIMRLGLRYVCGILPLAAGITGVLIARAAGGRWQPWAAGIVLFGFTHLAGNALPSLMVGGTRTVATWLYVHTPIDLSGKLLNTQWFAFQGELRHPVPGTMTHLVRFLEERAQPDDVVITNYGWDSLYFHTGMPGGLKIPAGVALEPAVRAAGLPAYVFDVDQAKWVVWRQTYPIPGYDRRRLLSEIRARGATVTRVARFHETVWENRPELHYHRFGPFGYLFAPPELGLDGSLDREATVYEVRWPAPEPGR